MHAVVIQSGSLRESFSGWVQQLRVSYSCAEALPPVTDRTVDGNTEAVGIGDAVSDAPASEGWVDIGRDLITGALSDPMVEHRVFLRVPIWARHLKLTPTKWKVSGLISTGENLTPKISMRVAVLAAPLKHIPSDADALGSRRRECAPAPGSLVCLFNLGRGCHALGPPAGADMAETSTTSAASQSPSMIPRLLSGAVRIVNRKLLSGTAPQPMSRLIGTLHPSCQPGDCVELEGGRLGVVTSVDDDGACSVLAQLPGQTVTEVVSHLPLEVVGEFDWQLSIFRMQSGHAVPAWATDMLVATAPALTTAGIVRAEVRLRLVDDWLSASDWLDSEGTCELELMPLTRGREAAPAQLRLRATELAYACARGTRLTLASSHSHQQACATVVELDSDGGAIVCVDNTRSLSAFKSWSTAYHGKEARGILHPVVVDPRYFGSRILTLGSPPLDVTSRY